MSYGMAEQSATATKSVWQTRSETLVVIGASAAAAIGASVSKSKVLGAFTGAGVGVAVMFAVAAVSLRNL